MNTLRITLRGTKESNIQKESEMDAGEIEYKVRHDSPKRVTKFILELQAEKEKLERLYQELGQAKKQELGFAQDAIAALRKRVEELELAVDDCCTMHDDCANKYDKLLFPQPPEEKP